MSLSAPLVRHPVGEEAPLRVALPLCSAIMEAVSSPRMAIALAQAGGIGFIHQNQPAGQQAEDVRGVKRNKAGFRHSELNVRPDTPLGDVSAHLRAADTDVAAVTSDGTANGVFLGPGSSGAGRDARRHVATAGTAQASGPGMSPATCM